MPDVRTIVTYLGVFGAGVVTASFFLSGPVERPNVFQQAPEFSAYNAVGRPGWLLPPRADVGNSSAPQAADGNPAGEVQGSALAPQQPPPAETTGMSPGPPSSAPPPAPMQPAPMQQAAQPPAEPVAQPVAQPAVQPTAGHACNIAVCRQYYQSFDEATCTYQPLGGRRQLCTR